MKPIIENEEDEEMSEDSEEEEQLQEKSIDGEKDNIDESSFEYYESVVEGLMKSQNSQDINKTSTEEVVERHEAVIQVETTVDTNSPSLSITNIQEKSTLKSLAVKASSVVNSEDIASSVVTSEDIAALQSFVKRTTTNSSALSKSNQVLSKVEIPNASIASLEDLALLKNIASRSSGKGLSQKSNKYTQTTNKYYPGQEINSTLVKTLKVPSSIQSVQDHAKTLPKKAKKPTVTSKANTRVTSPSATASKTKRILSKNPALLCSSSQTETIERMYKSHSEAKEKIKNLQEAKALEVQSAMNPRKLISANSKQIMARKEYQPPSETSVALYKQQVHLREQQLLAKKTREEEAEIAMCQFNLLSSQNGGRGGGNFEEFLSNQASWMAKRDDELEQQREAKQWKEMSSVSFNPMINAASAKLIRELKVEDRLVKCLENVREKISLIREFTAPTFMPNIDMLSCTHLLKK